MSSKSKGANAERELFHMFWNNNLACLRVAGSGSTTLPAPDLLVGGAGRVMAIECKAIKSGIKYLKEQQLNELQVFAKAFGAEPWVAIRFNRQGWRFLPITELGKSKGGTASISLEHAQKKGLTFEQFIGKGL